MTLFTAPLPLPLYRHTAGLYYAPPGTLSTLAGTNGTMRAVAFYLSRQRTADRIACEITANAGVDSGAVVRLGIYADNGEGYPGALILDAGTIAADGTTGLKPITISQLLGPGIIWLASVPQSAPTTRPTLRSLSVTPFAIGSADGLLNGKCAYIHTGVTGALPDNFTATPSAGLGDAPMLRFA